MSTTPLQRLPVLGSVGPIPAPGAAASCATGAPEACVPVPPADLAEATRLERLIAHRVGQAIADFALIAEGDRVMVALSGGKDSYTLLHVLEGMRKRSPVRFELLAVNVDQNWGGFQQDRIEAWLRQEGYRYRLVHADIAGVVTEQIEEGERLCSLCSRLRRGLLYRIASEEGATKIALGHHADDLIETLLLNQFFAGETKSMPVRLSADRGRHVVIRPLAYVPEDMIIDFARARAFPTVCCMCPTCGDETMKRKQIKALLLSLEAAHPGVKKSLLRSLSRVNTAHMLDRRWIDGGDGE